MTTTIKPLTISADLLAAMEQVARQARSKVRDPEARREACRRMDERRERIRQQHGILDIGVPAIREFRDR